MRSASPVRPLLTRLASQLPSRGSSFLHDLAWTFATRLGVVLLGLISSVLIARWLGPTGRGEYAVAVAVSAIAVQLGSLGLHTSSSWAVAQRPELTGRLLGNGVVSSLAIGSVLAVGIWLATIAFPGVVPLPEPLRSFALISIPVGLLYLVGLNLMLGLNRIRQYNRLELGNRSLSVALLVAAAALGTLSTPFAYLTVVIGSVAGATIAIVWLFRWSREIRVDLGVLLEYGKYGIRSYVAAIFTYLLLRVDLLLVQYLRGSSDAGLYSVAVGLADMLNLLPVVAATLLFPRLSAMRDATAAWLTARRVAAAVFVGIAALAVVALGLSGPLVVTLYGRSFGESVLAFQLLLPGVLFLSVQTILMHYFYSAGAPAVTLYAPLAGTVANVALNLILIPRYGIEGASIASTLAYGAVLLWCWLAFNRARPSGPEAATPGEPSTA